MDIADATGKTYTQTAADVGKTLRVVVTATNIAGSANATAGQSGVVAALAPTARTAPKITGTARDGETLTTDDGTWDGTQPLSFTYQWRRCDTSGASCVDIANANGSDVHRDRRRRRQDGARRRDRDEHRRAADSTADATGDRRRRRAGEPRRRRRSPARCATALQLAADRRHLDGTPTISLQLPMAALRRERRQLRRRSPARRTGRTRATGADVGRDAPRRRDGPQRRRRGRGNLRADRRGRRRAAGQQRRADDLRHRARRLDAHGGHGTWTGTRADRLRVPMAPLRRRRQRLRRHRRRDGTAPTSRRPPTSGTRCASS